MVGMGRRMLRERGGWCRGDTGLKEERVVGEGASCIVVVFERGRRCVIGECRHVDQWCVEEI